MGETVVNEAQENCLKKTLVKVTLVNCKQVVTLTNATGGTFKLAWEGSGWSTTIAYNAAAADVEAALEALSNIGSGNVSVTGSAGGPYTVEFIGALAATPMPLMTADATGLTGTSPTCVVTLDTAGAGTLPRYLYVGLSHSTRETLGDDAAMSAIDEVTGTGYARIRLKTDGVEIAVSKIAGFWKYATAGCTFSATAADWISAKAIFMTDRPDNTGKIWGLKTVTEFTLGNGQSQKLFLEGTFADAA